jgi:PAS domain S-box-containing protein
MKSEAPFKMRSNHPDSRGGDLLRQRCFALLVILLIAVGFTLFVLALDQNYIHILEELELNLLDVRFRIRGWFTQPSASQVGLVVVDEITLREYGYPLPRLLLIRAGASVVAYDVRFLGERETEGAALLAHFARSYPEQIIHAIPMNLSLGAPLLSLPNSTSVLPQMRTIPLRQIQSPEQLYNLTPGIEVLPNELFDHVSVGGTIAALPERDGSIRKLPLLVRYDDKYYPSLSLVAVCQFLQISLSDVKVTAKYLLLNDSRKERQIQIPIDSRGQMLINYQGGNSYFSTRSSLHDVYHTGLALPGFEDEYLLKQFQNRLIFIGASSVNDTKTHPMPFSEHFSGVAILATVADNILQANFLQPVPWMVNGVLAVFFTALLLLSQLFGSWASVFSPQKFLSVKVQPIIGVFILFLYIVVSLWLFIQMGMVVNMVVSIVTMGIAYILVLLYRYLVDYTIVSAVLYRKTQELAKYNEDIIENIANGLIVVDEGGRITKLNRKAYEILNLPDVYMVGQPYEQALADVTLFRDLLAETLATGRGIHNRAVEWNLRHLQITTSLLRADTGEVLGAVEILNDVTDLYRLQERLRHQARLAAIGRLSAELAHDIKNALQSILGFSNYLKKRFKDDDIAREALEEILWAGQRLNRLVQDLQDYPKEIRLKPQICELNATVLHTLATVKPHLVGIRVVEHLNAHLPRVVCDPEYLYVALENLLLNAIEAMGTEGTLTITTSVDSAYVNVAIADTGEGIPEEIQQKLFEPFVTGKRSGVGLGLARTYKIADAHAGLIKFTTEPGRGTCFVIQLPLESPLKPRIEEDTNG